MSPQYIRELVLCDISHTVSRLIEFYVKSWNRLDKHKSHILYRSEDLMDYYQLKSECRNALIGLLRKIML